eukprot:7620345-Pyramimonas_sp.AAC.1
MMRRDMRPRTVILTNCSAGANPPKITKLERLRACLRGHVQINGLPERGPLKARTIPRSSTMTVTQRLNPNNNPRWPMVA